MFVEASEARIAIYLPSLRGGGAERVMVTLANEFAKKGYCVDLVLASAEGPYLKEILSSVRVVNLNAKRVLTSLPGLIRYLRRERPTALLSAMEHANVIALLARKLALVPTRIVVSERNNASVKPLSNKGVISNFFRRRLMRWAYKRAEAVIAVSTGVAEDLSHRSGISLSEIDVVYNPVVGENIQKLAVEDVDQPWLLDDRPLIVGMGRLTEQKGFASLIHAFARVREQQSAQLAIFGEGELYESLKLEAQKLGIEEDVVLPGFVENPYSVLSRADLFVLSSHWEGLPNVLIQAMACGTPVVSTNCPSGPEEILEGSKWGHLVPVRDNDALAIAIIATLNCDEHPDVALRAKDFNVDTSVSGYLRLLLHSRR